MSLTKTMRQVSTLAIFLLALSLNSCGGSSSTVAGGVGTGGTGVTWGTVTGFGSLLIDGDIYNSATAQYLAGNDHEDEAPTSSMSVALGQQLRIQLDGQGNPTTVEIEPALIGIISTVDTVNGMLQVNGITVRVNTNTLAGPVTYFSGLSSLNSLNTGMTVEIHGLYGTDSLNQGYIQATRITTLPDTTTITRITGVVRNLNEGAGTFQIGTTTIRYDAATVCLPQGISLTNGQLAHIWSPNAVHAGQLNASTIKIRTLKGVSGTVVLSGLITARTNNQITVSGVTVDASDTNLATIMQSLALGNYVVVSGQPTTTTGVLIANSIRALSLPAAEVELKGNITNYVNATNFRVRGVAVDTSSSTFTEGNPTQLANGVYIKVKGHIQGNVVMAESVEITALTPIGDTVEYEGTVSAFSGDRFVLTLSNGDSLDVTLAKNIGFENGTAIQLVNGVRIEVEATNTSAGLVAYGISFKNQP